MLKRKGLLDRVISTILQSRMQITSKNYHRIWNSILTFSNRKTYSSEVALVFKCLSKSTLQLSVPFLDSQLTEQPWVKRFITASRRIHHTSTSSVSPWDLNLVLSALAGLPFEPLEEYYARHLTLKTTLQLAITTDRRVTEI